MATDYRSHPEYRQFIRQICATPADDMPRLVFADWLDEQGDTEAAKRAEFIRLSIEDRREKSHERRSYLLQSSLPGWSGEVGSILCGGKPLQRFGTHGGVALDSNARVGWEWSRGFVSEIRCTLAQFEQFSGRIAAEHPVEKWVITDADSLVNELGSKERNNIKYCFPIYGRLRGNILTAICNMHPKSFAVTPSFNTREAAIEALSRAAYVVARQRAEELENPPYEPTQRDTPHRGIDMPPLNVGDTVIANPETWKANEFDSWGRGIGVGVVVEPPFPVDDIDSVDVRWPGGRCFEAIRGLLPYVNHPPSPHTEDQK